VDDENRENEGDLIWLLQFATPDMINFMAVYAGLICLAMTGDPWMNWISPMVSSNILESHNAIYSNRFTVSVDASSRCQHRHLSGRPPPDSGCHIATKALDLRRPGHIFSMCWEGGVLKRLVTQKLVLTYLD